MAVLCRCPEHGYLPSVHLPTRFVLGHRAAAAALLVAAACAAPAAAQVRVVSYNVTNMVGDDTALRDALKACHNDDSDGFAVPVGVFMFCEVHQSGLAALQAAVNAAAPAGYTYALATFTTSSSEDSASGAQAVFYRTDLFTEFASGHADIFTGASRNADRWQLRMVGYDSTLARLYIYGAHLKASTGSANEAERLSGVQAIRSNADALGAGTHTLYMGDMNFYNNTETGYLAFFNAGNGQAWDPLGTGSWSGTGNAWKHTQSPRDITADGLVGGGMDDRFDFILPTAALDDDDGLSVIDGTYRALGNDGNHYNQAINAGNNTFYPSNVARSNTLADNLFLATDHIPVIVDLQVPAKNQATLVAPPARVIQNAVGVSAQVRMANAAAGLPIGVDAMSYTVTGSGVLSGTFNGTAPLTPSFNTVTLPVSTATVGLRTGAALATTPNQAAQNPSINLPVTVRIVRPSNPSLSSVADVNGAVVPGAATAGGAPVDVTIPVSNWGFGVDQSAMDITSTQVSAANFSVVTGTATGIGGTPGNVVVRFNPATVAAGTFDAPVIIQTRDENIPGMTTASAVATVRITVTGGCAAADLNCDGVVDGTDLGLLLSQWGSNASGDLNSDGTVDGTDLGLLLSAWG